MRRQGSDVMENSQENIEWYQKKLRSYDKEIARILKQEQIIQEFAQKDPGNDIYKRVAFIENLLGAVMLHLAKYRLAALYLRGKNEAILNDMRQLIYKVIIHLEQVVSNYIDVPFSDYADKLQRISHISQKERYFFIRKLGLVIDLMIDAYGENTKWKWSFVEIRGRYATIAKNILDLKDSMEKGLDPHSPDYETTVFHLRLVKKLLLESANRYREKYEMATSSIEDFRVAIEYLSALKRIHLVLNERNDMEEIKKKIEIWTDKMDKDSLKRKGK